MSIFYTIEQTVEDNSLIHLRKSDLIEEISITDKVSAFSPAEKISQKAHKQKKEVTLSELKKLKEKHAVDSVNEDLDNASRCSQ